jgi:signal peptidase I
MRPLRRWIVGGILVAAAVAVFGFFAPTQLGGGTTYAVTSGISMHPLLYNGDLALVRTEPSYHVGQVVLYQSPVLHRSVLHRIIVIQDGHYFFKGDNNSFVDPGYATRAELLGTMWFHIPAAGGVLSWFGRPAHAALLAGLAAMAVVLAAAGTTRRKRRRRGPKARDPVAPGLAVPVLPVPGLAAPGLPVPVLPVPGLAAPTFQPPPPDGRSVPTPSPAPPPPSSPSRERRADPTLTPEQAAAASGRPILRERRSGLAMTREQIAARKPPSYLDGPRWSLAAIATLAVICLLSLLVGFTRPTQRTTPLVGAYRQAGQLAFSGKVNKPTPIYPTGVVTTDEPIYPSLVSSLTISFSYNFSSILPHRIKGTIALQALVLSNTDTWRRLTTVKAAVPFVGDHAAISATLPLAGLYTLIDSLTAQAGLSGTSYSAELQPDVRITGTVGTHRITTLFQPVIPANISPNEIALALTPPTVAPGASYSLPTPAAELAATVNPVQSGSVPHIVTNTLSLARYKIPVPGLRVFGYLMAVLTLLLAGLHELLRRRMTHRSDEEIVAKHFNSLIVPVVSLTVPGEGDRSAIEVPTFTNLARLAQFLERPILYAISAGQRVYALDDESIRYLYRPSPAGEQLSLPPGPRPGGPVRPPPSRSGPRQADPSHRMLVRAGRVGAVVLAVVVAGTLTVSFTASTTVPASNAGTSVNPRAISELTPAGCSSLDPSTIVTLTIGSGKFTINTSHTLVLGSSGVDTITDTGGSNCIVGGAGKDVVKGATTDVCIIGPTTGASYHNCTTSA